ncbi:MAG: hypothetical protein MN733_32615 [Nitrososphaera sp.]|nr:hypothetical protein [Nitrososphaera sp.]
MSEPADKKETLHNNIRRLTKEIGKAKKSSQIGEIDNLRAQREAFARQLAEEFDEYYVLKEGKTDFVSLEDAHEHYKDPAVRKKIAGNNAVQQLVERRQFFFNKLHEMKGMTDAEVRTFITEGFTKEMANTEAQIHAIQKEIGENLFNFTAVDAKNNEVNKLLDGIDISSLMKKGTK